MLKVGEFSRLSQVTVKTLHHYDEVGLLKPSHTDPFTSYRYYTLDQLPRLHTIVALKELGLSLEEIRQLLSEELSAEQIRGMYRLKQAELQQRLREEQARLAQVEFRLRQIEQEGTASALDIVVKRIEPFTALTLRRTFHSREDREAIAHAIEAGIRGGQIAWTGGIPTSIFYEDEFRGDYLDTEMVVPVSATHAPVVALGEDISFTLRKLPAIESAAVYLHEGDYDSLNDKYLLLQRWAVENGYHLSGTWRFRYHRGPMHRGDPTHFLTEIQHQLEMEGDANVQTQSAIRADPGDRPPDEQ